MSRADMDNQNLASDRRFALALARFGKISPRQWRALRQICGGEREIFKTSAATLKAAGVSEAVAGQFLAQQAGLLKNDEETELVRRGVAAVLFDEPDYPPLLREIADPPPVLYYKGNIKTLALPAVSVVGTRKASLYGKRITPELVGPCARAGVVIVSGLALGIDALAHRAALDAGGKTAAVLGCGVDRVYPAVHESLAREIIKADGAVISEYPPGTAPQKYYFPLRNRIIAGLTKATVVIEAPKRSGSLITAFAALDYNREVLAVPGNIGENTSAGTNGLLLLGAKPALNAGCLLQTLGIETLPEGQATENALLSPEEGAVMRLLGNGERHLDELIRESGLPAATASAVFTLLEMRGLVRDLGGGIYCRNK